MKDPLYKSLKSKLTIWIDSVRYDRIEAAITAGSSRLRGMIINLPTHGIPKCFRGKYSEAYQFIIEYGNIKQPLGMTYGNHPSDRHVVKRFKGCVSMFLYRQLKLRMP